MGESRCESRSELVDVLGRPEKRPIFVFFGLGLLLLFLVLVPRRPVAGCELEPPDPPDPALLCFEGLFRLSSAWVLLEPFLRPNSFEKKPMIAYSSDADSLLMRNGMELSNATSTLDLRMNANLRDGILKRSH